jgi:hypothetical protein
MNSNSHYWGTKKECLMVNLMTLDEVVEMAINKMNG